MFISGCNGMAGPLPGENDATEVSSAPAQTQVPAATLEPTSTPIPSVTSTPAPTITPTPGIGSAYINPVDGARLLYIPAGEFQMGSDDGDSDERPVHTVYLDAYWMYETEVTSAQYGEFVANTNHPNEGSSWDTRYPQHPVVDVSWEDAVAYCDWAGGRLPTEAEWEKAARGEDGRNYPWGNDFDSSNVNSLEDGDGFEYNAPVGSFPGGAGPYGLLDMAGNITEWVADWYASDYYSNSPASNPQGPASGENRVTRGSSWLGFESDLRSANRGRLIPSYTDLVYGFRCASSTGP